MSADSISVAGMGVAVYAFQHSGNRQDGESPLGGKPGLAGGSADSALPAGAALGTPFCETGRAVVGGASGIDGSERSAEFYIQGAGRSEEHTSELQSLAYLVCRLLLEKKKNKLSSNASTPLL